MIKINDNITYIKASGNPLSADVVRIQGTERTWFFDVGNNEESLEFISATTGSKGIILSHFHPDHIGNLRCIDLVDINVTDIYIGDNTYKYTNVGTVVTEDLYIEDGCKLHIFPLPSSHAKGSLGLELDGSYAFLGDAAYPTQKRGMTVYNVQILREQIRVIEQLRANIIFTSHKMEMSQTKEEVLEELKNIYEKREKNQSFIIV